MSKSLLLTSLLLLSLGASAQYAGHGAESVSAETLKKFAPPALNPIMTNKLKKMFDISAPGMGALSPDKKTLYFTWRVTGQSHIWKIEAPQPGSAKSFPTQLTSGSDAVGLSEVAPNGKFLIISKDLNGQENPGLFRLDLKTGFIDELFRKPKVQAGFSFITKDSQTIYFTANDKNPDSYSVYKMNLADKSIETVYEGQGYWTVADQKENGRHLLLCKYTGALSNECSDLDTQTKNLNPIIGQNEKENHDIAYSAREGEYLVLTNKISNFKKLYTFKDGNLKALTGEIPHDVSGFTIDDLRKRIIYNINRDGYTELKAMDAKTFKPVRIPKFPGADHVFSGKSTRDSQVTMLGIITSKSPRVSYSYNWDTKKLTQWVLPSAPEVDLSQFSVSQLMNYETRDNAKIPMFVRFPKQCAPDLKKTEQVFDCPVVVHFHGGPEGQSEAGFSTMAQAFVDEGFIFVEPNVRGSDGYGKKWIEMDNGPLRENVVTDIEDASTWIKKNWKSSKGETLKVGIMGWSYGGYSTLIAMTRFAGAYEAGVALVGMSNLVSFLNNTAPYRRALRISEYGDPVKDKEALMKLSAVTYVDRVKAPLMIIQGANDPRVPVGEAIQIQDTLTKKKLGSELIIFADEGHGSAKKENQVLEIGHTIEFFKKHLMK
ncbi:MAG: S9 family peptidase [Bdellovibrio sp.]|nr:S9 family peptidase [Bdellovibrio sp.]